MLRGTLLYLANQERIRHFVTHNRLARGSARRFVAGETLEEALQATRTLNQSGLSVSLDHLGENVSDAAEAGSAANDYILILDAIKQSSLNANISIKLTALGLDIDNAICEANVRRVLDRAKSYGIFVRVDMEGSAYTERTLEMVARLRQDYEEVGTVIQSCLYRSPKDIERLIASQTRVRLVKGAYKEPPEIAYPHKADVDRSYEQLMRQLLAHGKYPAIATHDQHMIQSARAFAADNHIDKTRFEFQMLYGIRRDLQKQLVNEGYNVRVYVPYGTQWYPYLTRRMAERPANLLFVMSNAARG
ncbi:MAG TPA: proline dehydrogenase family protein [Ktedonobacterales bacterium]|nr:proline dehydrogenase family protein [Ktedonobacterales bacterium]